MNTCKKWLGVGLLSLSLVGCGGGGNSSSPDTSAKNNPGNNFALLGPLIGADVKAYRLNDLQTPIEQTTTFNLPDDFATAGSFSLTLSNIPEDEWLLVSVSGGEDIDADDDGVLDSSFTANHGTIYLLAKKEDLITGANVNAISDIIVREIMYTNDLSTMTAAEITSGISSIAGEWIADINGDGAITYSDVSQFNPLAHKTKSKILWDVLTEQYISAVHANHSKLIEKIHLLKETGNEGYAGDAQEAQLIKKTENHSVVAKAFSVNSDTNIDAAIIEEVNGPTYTKTRISKGSSGSDIIEYSITNGNGNDLTISFSSENNLLSTLDEAALEQLITDGKITFEETVTNGKSSLVLNIPKSIMSSWGNADISLKFNNQYIKKEYLTVIDDDPIIGWYFNDSPRGTDIIYEVPPDYKAPPDGIIIITQEAIVRNDGGLKFKWREEECADDETKLLESPYILSSRIVNSGLFKLCIKHDEFLLTTQSGTALLNYNESSGKVFTRHSDTEIKLGIKGSKSENFKISTVISKPPPPTDSTYDGWSSGLSFANGLIGDYAADDYKIWVAITSKDNSILHHGKAYQIIGSNLTGRLWLDRNLGASRACQSPTDTQCFGDYYQWGRPTDGHEDPSSKVTSKPYGSPTSTGSRFFIEGIDNPIEDWVIKDSSGAYRAKQWMRTDGRSVCPPGFRVPTMEELTAELQSLPFSNTNDATFNHFLKLPYAGWRQGDNGNVSGQGKFGNIWATSQTDRLADAYHFVPNLIAPSRADRTFGLSVRCISD